MNNEIQISSLAGGMPTQGGMPGALGNFYGGGNAPAGGGQEAGPLKKVHRLLRGRYLLAFVLGFMGAAAGAVAGYLSQKPAYKADALLEIRPIMTTNGPDPTQSDKVMTMFQSYINSQVAKLQSDKLIRQAMQDERWKAVRPGATTEAGIAAFGDNLTITVPPKANTMIMVSYASNSPDSKKEVAAAAQALVSAFLNDYQRGDKIKADAEAKVVYWENQIAAIRKQMDFLQTQIQQQTKITDGDPSTLRNWEAKLAADEQELQTYERMQEVVKKVLAEEAAGTRRKVTAQDWARVDGTMAKKVVTRDELQLVIRSLIAQFGGDQHQLVVSRKKEFQVIEEEINRYAAEMDAKYVLIWKPDGTGGTTFSKDLGTLAESKKQLVKQIAFEQDKVQALRESANKIGNYKMDIDRLNIRSAELANTLRDWKYRAENTSLLSVLSDGSVAKADKDRRPIFAAVGFMGGAGIPIGLLLLFGLFDTRYRYSDETGASATSIGGLTLLGILPNLPDRLSDPEQAAIAAHCVHQIRTMLQINTGMEDRRVFSVTSASPGDGKTSLTLALGLSYAACGTRTLLIDCDLIGSGLSSRMNVSAPEGVLEAIANRSLMNYVRQTDVNDVSILPVGTAGNLHASTLSPQSLRRLIEEAEQHFEVVLIDTGPILGSIEASLVCAAADAVILTVSRGQQRPMVERSLGHLGAIGARLAGVVFNRAQAQDFERSISGVSMRSVGVPGLPRGTRPAGPRLGPVARAVRGDGSTMATDDHDDDATN